MGNFCENKNFTAILYSPLKTYQTRAKFYLMKSFNTNPLIDIWFIDMPANPIMHAYISVYERLRVQR